MAGLHVQHDPQYLRAIVDMGSNGIRFSISTVQAPTARIMPTLYQRRAGISLYDAQYSTSGDRQSIGEETISAVILVFKQFKQTCADFQVPQEHITVLATEATRTAINSEEFQSRIKDAVGWVVSMLSKEDEGRLGAMGIASSLPPEVFGLVMDLGGGSTQLMLMPESGAVSLPYGAAAMTRRLGDAQSNGTTEHLRSEVLMALKAAYKSLKVPQELRQRAQKQGGYTLYLSGGGFRGWGYVLMSRHRVHPYPISAINGFKASRADFMDTETVKEAAASALQNDEDEIFRVSNRRASQVPAVAFLITALAEALPEIKEVRFCQGGVREGYLFSSLEHDMREENPLVVATQPFRPASAEPVVDLLNNALTLESPFTPQLIEAFANMMYYHSTHPKDLQGSSALRCTTSGVVASVHGLLHEDRALLALLLYARWTGDLSPADAVFKTKLEELVESPQVLWRIKYIGAVAALIGAVYPAGITQGQETRLRLKASWDVVDSGHDVISLEIGFPAADFGQDMFDEELKNIEKVGKKKRWIGGKQGVGHRVNIQAH